MARRPKPRRGVLLLIVLSLLVLFLMVGLSFIVSAGQFKQLSSQDAKTDLTGMPGEKLANAALYQIIRDSNNPQSDLRRHSLLEDLYGRDFLKGTAKSVVDYESGNQHQTQLIQFDINMEASGVFTSEGNTSSYLAKLDDYYGGCVLTYTSGNAKGRSTRVVKFHVTAPAPFMITLGVLDDNALPPEADSEFIINGRPLNGVGAGYDPATGRLSRQLRSMIPLAYTPNLNLVEQLFATDKLLPEDHFDLGGLDEPWDNVDFQNMFLAKPANPGVGTSDNLFVNNTAGAIPSFHRPFLYAYLQQKYSNLWNSGELRHLFMLRPSSDDHPAFTGSNPDFDPINGPWDVDNDGEGTPDSVWIDAGLAPLTGPDGRMYKPLIAPLILPLDGRINANTADSVDRLSIDGSRNAYLRFNSAVVDVTNGSVMLHNSFGSGFGPADVAVGGPQGPNNFLAKQLAARYQPVTGAVDVANSRAGLELTDDDALLRSNGVGRSLDSQDYMSELGLITGFGSPADLAGRGLPFIDKTGNLVWRTPIQTSPRVATNDGIDDPYELDPYQTSAVDHLFELTELEPKLRRDANPLLLTTSTRNLPGNASRVTTISSYIPAPITINSGRFRAVGADGLRRSIRDIFAARLLRDQRSAGVAVSDTAAFAQAEAFVPNELIRGEKLDINRVLTPNRPTDAVENTLLQQKRLFARDLYHMMMLVSDAGITLPEHFDNGVRTRQNLTAEQRQLLHARRVAQWAINVVDFGDADSVMTRFVYDPTPFNDPQADNPSLPATPTQLQAQGLDVVWGCEHPELLLTETLALHDRRVKDLQVGGKRKDNIGEEDDNDLDQAERPQGSLFVELYCPRAVPAAQVRSAQAAGGPLNPNGSVVGLAVPDAVDLASQPPTDLYQVIGNSLALDLGRVPAGSSKPTWRIAISERHLQDPKDYSGIDDEVSALQSRQMLPDVASFEPEDFDRRIVNEDPNVKKLQLERFIWFSALPPAGTGPEEQPRNTYYARPDANTAPPFVKPGDYVVVGPRLNTQVGPRAISLTPAGITRNMIPVIAQTQNKQAGCSISEPTDTTHYYGSPGANGEDQPYDEDPPDENSQIPVLEQRPLWEPLPDPDADEDDSAHTLASGTRENIRSVFLQRLANPNRPWDPILNPYRTIDWMPVDLTVFNSLDEETSNNAPEDSAGNPLPFDPRDPKGAEVLGANERWEQQQGTTGVWSETEFNFGSREKAGFGMNLWTADTQAISTTRWKAEAGKPAHPYLQLATPPNNPGANLVKTLKENPLYHTLGWLNRAWDVGQGTNNPTSYDGLGHFYESNEYYGVPFPYLDPETNLLTTFPSFLWNNRPYANEYETLLVPACSQARLTHEYSVSQPVSAIVVPNNLTVYASYFGPFQHLLNFFQSSFGTPGETAVAQNFYRVFDFVHVPSRFRGAERWFNPSQLSANNPFFGDPNYSNFREPGRVWMNGVVTDSIFLDMGMDGLLPNTATAINLPGLRFYNTRDFEQTLAANAQRPGFALIQPGAPTTSEPERFPTGNVPAMYPNPLRAAAAADLVPEVPATALGVDATLLRSSSYVDVTLNPNGRQPALAKYRDVLTTGSLTDQQKSQGLSQYGQAFQNRKTNAFFRYRDIQKVGASASAQTNVYAIWITVGYFEMEPNFSAEAGAYTVDAAHPDGYSLGSEMGSELGNVTRHRSFYIIDRSVPVAFEPGVNHNVDDAILYRRTLD